MTPLPKRIDFGMDVKGVSPLTTF